MLVGARNPGEIEKLVPYLHGSLPRVLGAGHRASLLGASPHPWAQQYCKNLSTNEGINQEIETFGSTKKVQVQCPVGHLCCRGTFTALPRHPS